MAKDYMKKQPQLIHDFVKANEKNLKMKAFLEIIADPSNECNFIPRFVFLCRNKSQDHVIQKPIINSMLCCYFLYHMRIYNTSLQTSLWKSTVQDPLASLQNVFGLLYSTENFKGFPDSMDAVCAAYCAEGPLESPPDTTQKKEQKNTQCHSLSVPTRQGGQKRPRRQTFPLNLDNQAVLSEAPHTADQRGRKRNPITKRREMGWRILVGLP